MLESKRLTLKNDVDDIDNAPPDDFDSVWVVEEEFNGPLALNGVNYRATLMIWDGEIRDTKFSEIDYNNMDFPTA